MTYLPDPPAAGPTPGSPGHFAHHEWLEDGLQNLDQLLMGLTSVRMVSTTQTQTCASNTIVQVKLDTVVASAGVMPLDIDGATGLLTCGAGWVSGLYRIDFATAFAGQAATATGARSARVLVNGANPTTTPSMVNVQAPDGSNRPSYALGMGLLFLKEGDTITLEARHDGGANLDTLPGNTFLTLSLLSPQSAAVV